MLKSEFVCFGTHEIARKMHKKITSGWGSVPDPAGVAYDTPQTP